MLGATTIVAGWRFLFTNRLYLVQLLVSTTTTASSSSFIARRCALEMAATTIRRAPYKDFLQPALHRRFSSTATVLLAVSYVQAVFLSHWDSCEYIYQGLSWSC